jgi:segregation and condensation protein A
MSYEIKLDIFEGPLDLLLYLIKKNEIDIYNIPIATITDQYLKYMEILKSIDLDLAGEYLVLASTLAHIKSRMLLPELQPYEDEKETEEDPRAELVWQLLQYQTYKEAAARLNNLSLLERDVFKRGSPIDTASSLAEETPTEIDVFELIKAFQKIISRMDKSEAMAIDAEKITLADRINDIMERLTRQKNLNFAELLENRKNRKEIVYTFLAVLELMKMRIIKAYQVGSFGIIRLFLAEES